MSRFAMLVIASLTVVVAVGVWLTFSDPAGIDAPDSS